MLSRPIILSLTTVIGGLGLSLSDAVIVVTALTVGVFALIRGRADVWKSNYEAERDRGDRLEKQALEVAQRLAEATSRISTLEAIPSVEKLYDTIVGHNATEKAIWERITGVLDQISAQLDNVAGKLQ